ncbi:MAG: ABC transporter permease [Balneolaceae bacterium]|nr:ABC transporter permease [Balneolaceae bacterium]MBO6547665.1 ABC transporter permease [Balneolaceae bacterium]MBO6648176.1 ABC transporter permease [Balneolaceae bacterium]
MSTIRFLLRKEFLQIFRNKSMLPIIFVMPVIQLLVLSFAATYELKEVNFALVDMDRSIVSQQLITQMQATGYFELWDEYTSTERAVQEMDKGVVSLVMVIPKDFSNDFATGTKSEIQLIIDAVDGSTAGLIQSYASSIITEFGRKRNGNAIVRIASVGGNLSKSINLISVNWYNPQLDYLTYMVPGILVVLVSMIGLFLSGMNIVREREIGTIEQLNVTPLTKSQFMIGKLVPFWIIGMFDLLVGLALARFGFEIPFLGNLFTILIIAGIYLILIQALGLFISTITDTQQQAMFIAWFIMVVFILMGGLFTPIESMPGWAQDLTLGNPVAYFIKIMRMVLLKGAGWKEVLGMVLIMGSMAIGLLGISINRYKKTVN